jgi:ClpP class serine protease
VQLAKKDGVLLIAFIAPYVSMRVSPIQEVSASISIPDEFGVETVINKIKKSKLKKGYLLVNSPGGGMASSYKIARALRMCLDDITVFVPHVAGL